MNNLRNYLGLSALTMGLCLMSCNDDNTPSYSQTTMKNSELKTILQQNPSSTLLFQYHNSMRPP